MMMISEEKKQNQNAEESPKNTTLTTFPVITRPTHAAAVTTTEGSSCGSTVKSNPLHNFALSDIKWATSLSSNRLKKLTLNEPCQQPESNRKILGSDKNLAAKNKQIALATVGFGSDSVYSSVLDNTMMATEKLAIMADVAVADVEDDELPLKKRLAVEAVRQAVKVADVENVENRKKLLIRLRTGRNTNIKNVDAPTNAAGKKIMTERSGKGEKIPIMNKSSTESGSVVEPSGKNELPAKNKAVAKNTEKESEEVDIDNLPLKTWNLRPRKKVAEKNTRRSPRGIFANSETEEEIFNSKKPLNGCGGVKKEKKKGKKKVDEVKLPKFSLTLTKVEIADDILLMTGKLPSRKSTKRNKNLQQQLDMLTPGLGFDSIKPGRYKVDPPQK